MTKNWDRVRKWLWFANFVGRSEVPQQRQTGAERTCKEESRDHGSSLFEKAVSSRKYNDQRL